MWQRWLRRLPHWALQTIAIIGMVIQSVRIIEEARTIIKAKRKRPPGFR